MRITEIEIKNFRAFYGSYQINLHKAGKNLLIYGENGSGKSSLYMALKLFLESAVSSHQFEDFWRPIKCKGLLKKELIEKIELYRKIILNPLSHDSTINPVKKEIAEAIEAVEDLEKSLSDN